MVKLDKNNHQYLYTILVQKVGYNKLSGENKYVNYDNNKFSNICSNT